MHHVQSRTELKSRACRRHTVNSKYKLDTKDTKEQVETYRIGKITILAHEGNKSVPDLDLEIKGAPVIQTLRKGAARSPKEFFRPFGPQFGLKIRGGGKGGRAPWAPPLDPPLDFVAVTYDFCMNFFSLLSSR